MTAVRNTVSRGRSTPPPYAKRFMTQCNPTVDEVVDKKNGMDTKTTLYGECYKGVCIEESQHGEVLLDIDEPEKISSTVMVPEKAESVDVVLHIVRCFDFIHLIHGLSMDKPVDPVSSKSFSANTEKMLMSRYTKEIKMYKRYLKNLRQSGIYQ